MTDIHVYSHHTSAHIPTPDVEKESKPFMEAVTLDMAVKMGLTNPKVVGDLNGREDLTLLWYDGNGKLQLRKIEAKQSTAAREVKAKWLLELWNTQRVGYLLLGTYDRDTDDPTLVTYGQVVLCEVRVQKEPDLYYRSKKGDGKYAISRKALDGKPMGRALKVAAGVIELTPTKVMWTPGQENGEATKEYFATHQELPTAGHDEGESNPFI